MAKIFIEESTLSAIGNSIRAKTGRANMIPPLNMPAEIASIQTDGGGSSTPISANDVTFYDYDGTVVASYSLEEAQALTALPYGLIHDGLTFKGWNYTLEKVKTFTRSMNVGAMYITNDRKTRLHIHIADKARSTVPLHISQNVANGVTIDWGDGSTTETLAGTGNLRTSHAYGTAGDFIISLSVADGCTLGFGEESSSYCVMGATDDNNEVYRNMLQKVEIGSGVTRIASRAFYSCGSLSSIIISDGVTSIGSSAFYSCGSLSSIIIPDGVTSIGNSAFHSCYSLSSIIIPDGVTSIDGSAFRSCYSLSSIIISDGVTSIDGNAFYSCGSLSSIIIPDGVTSIGNYTFNACGSLSSITIPDGVTTIGSYTFARCYGMAEYHLKPITPPTLSDINAFEGIRKDCIMYVPQGSLEAYQTATNWATYASYMQEETT